MLENLSIHAFIQKYQIKNEKGDPIEFRNHLFLFDIYRDFSKKLAVLKAAQIGMSTCEIIKSIWGIRNKGMDSVYILPTDSDVNSMVGSKVNRIIAQNPILQEWTKDKDTIEQKQIGKNYIHYRGCFDEKTELLTTSGWKKYNEVKIEDEVLSLNMFSECVEVDFVKDLNIFKADEKVVSLKGKGIDALLTKDHRCIVRRRGLKNRTLKIKSASDITRNDIIPSRWKGITEKDNMFWELVGFVIGDGSFWTERYKNKFVKNDGTITPKTWEYKRVCIIQKKNTEYIESVLDSLGGDYYIKKRGGCNVYELSRKLSKRIRDIIPNKKLTFDIVNKAVKKSIYKGLMMSDGDGLSDSVFYQSDREMMDSFQYLCVCLGRQSSLKERKKSKESSFSDRSQWTVGVRKTKNVAKIKVSSVGYKGIMWCPTTNNGTVFIRRNGKVSVTGQSWSAKAAIMVTSDWNCYDEVDACKQDIVEQYSTRLQHSKYKWEHYFSHPSSVGTGIDKHWQKSDQKHWFIKCEGCGEEQYMEYPQSFDLKKEIYICKHCGKELTDEERRVGRWVAKYEDREYSGYWIPLFIAPWVSAKDIINYQKEKSEEYFYNKVLGLPYVGGGNKLTKAHLMQNLTGEEIITPLDNERVIIGVDTGTNLYYVVGGQNGIFFYGQAKEYQEIEDLMRRWTRSIVVIDQGGDLIGCRALREKYPGRVFLCLFGTDRKTKELVRWGKNDEDGAVIADRNRCIQLVVDEFTDGRIPIQGEENDWYDYWLHWNNLTRVKEIDDKTGDVKRKIWVKNGQSDWSFATVYWRIGMSRFGNNESKIIGGKDIDIEESPVIYPGNTMDSKFALGQFKKPKINDWRRI